MSDLRSHVTLIKMHVCHLAVSGKLVKITESSKNIFVRKEGAFPPTACCVLSKGSLIY